MAITGNAIDVETAAQSLTSAIVHLGNIALWLQAIGVIVILWIIFEGIALWFANRRMKEIYAIKKDMKRIEQKIDSIARKKR